MNKNLRQLHEAMLDLAGFFNHPKIDDVILKEAGLSLDRALFPLLVRVERRGPLGIVELAGLVGRDYSTVSRQVGKMEGMNLVARRTSSADARISQVTITKRGRKMTDALDMARERLAGPILASWSEKEKNELTRLLRKFIDDALGNAPDARRPHAASK